MRLFCACLESCYVSRRNRRKSEETQKNTRRNFQIFEEPFTLGGKASKDQSRRLIHDEAAKELTMKIDVEGHYHMQKNEMTLERR